MPWNVYSLLCAEALTILVCIMIIQSEHLIKWPTCRVARPKSTVHKTPSPYCIDCIIQKLFGNGWGFSIERRDPDTLSPITDHDITFHCVIFNCAQNHPSVRRKEKYFHDVRSVIQTQCPVKPHDVIKIINCDWLNFDQVIWLKVGW